MKAVNLREFRKLSRIAEKILYADIVRNFASMSIGFPVSRTFYTESTSFFMS
jgi:hypothetical protein